jgi:hypothetical protein
MRRILAAVLLACAPIAAADTSIPFILVANHIYFRVSVNDHPASSFLLDTGAGASAIDRDHAQKLELSFSGHGEAHGSGEKTVEIQLVARPNVSFGHENVQLQYLAAVPLIDLGLRDGRPMQGVLGFDILSRYTVTIDYAHRTLHFEDPQQFRTPKNAVVLPLRFVSKTPVVRGVIATADGRRFPIDMLLDTGGRGAIRLNTQFVKKQALEKSITNRLQGPLGIGVGGTTTDTIARIASVELAGFVMTTPVVSFASAKAGTDAETDFQAQLGGEILRRFTLIIDYARQRFLLIPNTAFNEPFEYDMSGLLLDSHDATFRHIVVGNVIPSSPAAEAGIAVGDEIQSIDDSLASAIGLNDIRMLLMRPGTHKMTILRGKRKLEITLVARRLI